MKNPTFALLALLALFGAIQPLPLAAQNAASEAEAAGRSLLADPRLQNMLRSVKNDPEAAVESIKAEPEESVREATEMFLNGKEKLESSSLNTPENREKARQLSEKAVSTATQMAQENEGAVTEARSAIESATGARLPDTAPEVPATLAQPVDTPATPPPANVPATRPANSATHFVTPIAMPTEEAPTPLSADAMPQPISQNTTVEPIADAAPTEAQIPDIPGLDPGSVPEPKPLAPKYDTKSGGQSGGVGNQMVITSRNSVMDNNSGLLTFTGDVFVDYPDFDIKCERLEIYMDKASGGTPTEGGGSFKKAIASGGMVEIRRIGEGGKTQIALAKRAEFDNTTKDVVLSGGPPYIQDGQSFVETNSADAKIIMRGNGKYEITGSDAGTTGRSRIVIPVKDTGQNADTGLGGGLGGILDRGR